MLVGKCEPTCVVINESNLTCFTRTLLHFNRTNGTLFNKTLINLKIV